MLEHSRGKAPANDCTKGQCLTPLRFLRITHPYHAYARAEKGQEAFAFQQQREGEATMTFLLPILTTSSCHFVHIT